MRGRTRFMLPLAVALVLIAAACGGYGGGNKSSESGGGTTTVAGQSANDHGSKDVSNMSKADVDLYDYYFEPTVLKGTPGQKITLELSNEGKTEHNFSITNQQVDQNIEAGKKAEVEVTFPASGTLSFFCKFHQSQGMVGGLTVSGNPSSGGGGMTSTEQISTGYSAAISSGRD